jgi:hypothetical protein
VGNFSKKFILGFRAQIRVWVQDITPLTSKLLKTIRLTLLPLVIARVMAMKAADMVQL